MSICITFDDVSFESGLDRDATRIADDSVESFLVDGGLTVRNFEFVFDIDQPAYD